MNRTAVINIVGLTSRLIGEHTPFLRSFLENEEWARITPVLPAVTCTAQATYLTGALPQVHGIVGNGWYFKDECEIKFWRQSNKLVTANKIWEDLKEQDPNFTCANLFWWYNMYSSVDYSVTPRPNYLADGRKIPDIYSHPADLRDTLQTELGRFPLFHFWGPKTSLRSSKWIAEAAKRTESIYKPTLSLVYLPHLDYNLQRYGTSSPKINKDLKEIDGLVSDLVAFYEANGVQVILLSEYGITDVSHPIHLNRIFRKKGWLQIREERGLELLDAGASKAFAVADHQIAHVYVNDPKIRQEVRTLLLEVEGIERVIEDRSAMQLDHSRAGDFITLADSESWFTYYYWEDDKKAPDFARTVDIHRKPGYDPAELFLDPRMPMAAIHVLWKLLRKKMGFRTLMNVIPLQAELVKGSHGRIPENEEDHPILLTNKHGIFDTDTLLPTEVRSVIERALKQN